MNQPGSQERVAAAMLEERGLLDVEHLVLLYAVFEFADVRDERVVVAPWRQPRGKALERLIARAGDDVALRPGARDRAQRARADATDRRSQTLLRRLSDVWASMATAEVPFIPSPLLHNVDGDPRSGPVVVGTVCWYGPTCLISRRVTMLFAEEAEPSDRRESGQTTTDRAIPHPPAFAVVVTYTVWPVGSVVAARRPHSRSSGGPSNTTPRPRSSS